MPITLYAVGSLAQPTRDLSQLYEKRLSRYDRLVVHEVKEEKEPQPHSDALLERAMLREGERLLRLVQPGDYLIALCIDGAQVSSEAFAGRLQGLKAAGKRPAFVIGGSNGLHQAVIAAADERLSLSSMTFPHQLARVLLLEQLYRAHKIMAGERYHK